ECMSLKRFPFNWHRLGVREFRDRELEHEFRQGFRSAGVRFFGLATAVTGLAYFAFFLIYLANAAGSPFAQPQPLRLLMVVSLLSAAGVARFAKPFLVRHYVPICVSVVAV